MLAMLAMLLGGVALPSASSASAEPGLVLASGTVTSGAGMPLANVPVLLYAWPGSAELTLLRPGRAVPWRMIGSTTTDADGRYVAGVSSTEDLRHDAAGDGTLNLEVVAVGADGLGLFSFPRRLTRASDGALVLTTTDAGGAGVTTATPARADLRVRPATSQPGGPAAGASGPAICLAPQYVRSYGPQWALVGQTYVTTTGVTQAFTYQYGQSSSLGVGVSPTAGAGSFSQGGTMSQSSTVSETFPTYGARTNVYYFTEFVYGLFKIVCVAGRTPNGVQPNYIVYYQTQPTSYAGGTMVRFPYTAPSARDCVPQLPGSTFHSNNSSAITWSDGLVIPVIGISLSTQTGYDSSAQVTYYFLAAHWLCGTGGFPGGTPYQLVANS